MRAVSSASDLEFVDYTMSGGHKLKITDYFGHNASFDPGPQANLCEFWRADPTAPAEELVPPHFHHVRQFLVFTDTGLPDLNDEFEDVPQFSFQFTDPSTPYGPVMVDSDYMAFFAMRSKADIGGHPVSTSSHKLRSPEPGRRVVVTPPPEPSTTGLLETLLERHDDGLAAYRIVLGPGESTTGPDPSTGDGQYWIVMRGSVVDEGTGLPPLSLLWVGTADPPGSVTAGEDGAAAMILQFPFPNPEIEITEEEWEAVHVA
jgi:hypothetical protein